MNKRINPFDMPFPSAGGEYRVEGDKIVPVEKSTRSAQTVTVPLATENEPADALATTNRTRGKGRKE